MIQPDLFGYEERSAEIRKEKALVQVRENSGEWFERALATIAAIPTGWSGIGEDIRGCVSSFIGQPHDPHAWGSLISVAIRRKLLKPTGRFQKMKSPTSNARKSEVYTRS